MKRICTLCGGSKYHIFAFKSGYICEDCLQQLKPPSDKHQQTKIER